MFVHLNGRLVPADEARVPVWDGGYLYGDGIYTTLRLYAGRPLDLPAHLDRLTRMAAELQLPWCPDAAAVRTAIAALAAANELSRRDGRLRITVSRGGAPAAGPPLVDLGRIVPTTLMTLVPLPPEVAAWARDGIPVVILGDAFARGNFPSLKTLNSLATLQALRRAAAAGCPEAILTGRGGRLLEGAVSNLFLVRGGRLATPAAEGSFLAGRTRERILDLAAHLGLTVDETRLDAADLRRADEAFAASSVREVLPIVVADGRKVGDGKPGAITRRLQRAYADLIRKELAATSPPPGPEPGGGAR